MFSCQVDLSGFRRAAARTIDAIQVDTLTAVRMAAQEGVAEAKSVGPFKDRTGNLRKNIYAKFISGNLNGAKWAIVSPEKYSVFVENPTKPHEIWPKVAGDHVGPTRRGQSRRADNDYGAGRGHALRWVSGGFTFFAKMVHHHGTRGFPFMGPALQKAERVLYRELGAIGNKVARIWL